MTSAGSVFIVDDNPHNLSLLAGILRGAGYEVRVAQSGRRALAALDAAAEPPELVMLDINMPELNGIELCKQLKLDPRHAELPVIFLSALDDVNDKLSAFSAGGVDYVTKPFHNDEVLARVATQLKLARLRRELEARNRELAARNQQLFEAWRNTDHVFSALSDALAGSILHGRYVLEEKIGMGGFSAIYRGRHLELGRPVAIKILRPDSGDPATYLARFRNEGFSAARVNHPNAVAVLDSGVTPSGVAYLVMELLEGRSLAEELAAAGPLPLSRCGAIVDAVCAVLAHAHGSGILHRDIKPANIFLHRPAGGEETVKVVDFGIAKLFDEARAVEALTTVGRLLGTPVYMSPERLLGKAHDERSDSYGVGMTLFQMLCGRLPFAVEGEHLGSVVMTCLAESPTPLRRFAPDAPAALEELLARCLAKKPAERPSVGDLAAEFRRILDGIAANDGSLGDVAIRLDQRLATTVELS